MLHIRRPSRTTIAMVTEVGRGEFGTTLRVLTAGWPRVHTFNHALAEYVTDALLMPDSEASVLTHALSIGAQAWQRAEGGERARVAHYVGTILDLVVPLCSTVLLQSEDSEWTLAGGEPLLTWAETVDWRTVGLTHRQQDEGAARRAVAEYTLDAFLSDLLAEHGHGVIV